jgi:hypothetical protein
MECPHCGIGIEILEINCAIFRCGVYKDTYQQIPPHLPKTECDALVEKIYGCGKPFQLVGDKLEPCDYV